MGAVFVVMLSFRPPLLRPEGLLLLVVMFSVIAFLQRKIQFQAMTPLDDGSFLGTIEFEFEDRGFHPRRPNSQSFNQWSLVKDVTETRDHVFLWIDACTAYVIPARDLPAGMSSSGVATRIREFMTHAASAQASSPVMTDGASDPQATIVPSPDAQSAPQTPAPPSVAQELGALLRLHVWRAVDATKLHGRDISIILLGALSFALWVALDRLNYGGDVEFFWYSAYENGVVALPVLLAGWILSRLSRPRIEMRRALLLVLGFLPIFLAVIWIATRLPLIGAAIAGFMLFAAAEVFFVRGMKALTGRRQQFAVTSVLISAFALFYLSTRFYFFSPTLWFEPEADPEQAAETQRADEQLVFEQSARIDADVAKLAPRMADQANVFFVGFAGFGGQKVFAEEIGLAAKNIGERYGAAQRSVLLVNDRRNALKHPLATVPSLRHTLNALSQHMNLDEDVLFLALSSHGSQYGTVSVSTELGYWSDLGATELAGMLRESGIRWRVIVVSACYSGTFIEPLKDDNTIILTAAAPDRTSFGCSDDNDLTYFGEAFYRDALPEATNLRAAFDSARAAILERETDEGAKPSSPQAFFGKAIEQKLAAMEASRRN
jgi:hypothetical protein